MNGLFEFAPKERLVEWETNVKDFMARLGLQPLEVVDCFPPPEPVWIGPHIPTIVHLVDTSVAPGPSLPVQ
ncbi:hypothetical protein SUGI_0536640 [Cryptomeria japonica]|nr:hypothetical protein SUGI_0536640 [Cryptomeria japonica]